MTAVHKFTPPRCCFADILKLFLSCHYWFVNVTGNPAYPHSDWLSDMSVILYCFLGVYLPCKRCCNFLVEWPWLQTTRHWCLSLQPINHNRNECGWGYRYILIEVIQFCDKHQCKWERGLSTISAKPSSCTKINRYSSFFLCFCYSYSYFRLDLLHSTSYFADFYFAYKTSLENMMHFNKLKYSNVCNVASIIIQ